MKQKPDSNTKQGNKANTLLAVSGLLTKDVETAAKKHASEILGIPPNEILPDDTIVNGFMAGVWWVTHQAAGVCGAVDKTT